MKIITKKALFNETDKVRTLLENTDTDRVRGAIENSGKTFRDLALMLSVGADSILEEMAVTAEKITKERFGNTMQLYAPIYLSNHCNGSCPYCGFRKDMKIPRKALSLDEITTEASLLRESGMRSILLVSGDDKKNADISSLAEAVKAVRRIVPSVSVEVAPLTTEEYQMLASAGADNITLYQETYNQEIYSFVHSNGPKKDFNYRLEALSRAGAADFCKLNTGVLWGLSEWREDALCLGVHTRLLETTYWRSHISIGLPRLKGVPKGFEIPFPLSDLNFAHIIIALRIFLPDAGLVLSTREPSSLRNKLMRLGITQMSAGSSTKPGGYKDNSDAGEQFEVSDRRTPAEVALSLEEMGFEPVWKNWDEVFVTGADS